MCVQKIDCKMYLVKKYFSIQNKIKNKLMCHVWIERHVTTYFYVAS